MTNQEKLEIIKTKIRKQKIGTIKEIDKYRKLFDKYFQLSAQIRTSKKAI